MNIEIKCFATLREYCPEEGRLEIQEDATVGDVLNQLKMPLEEVKLIFINGVRAELTSTLSPDDRLGVFPPVGGG